MTQETKAPPTVVELEGKVQRLTTQVENDAKSIVTAERAIESAMKSNDLARVLELSSAREVSAQAAKKSASQLKTAQGAVESAVRAKNAGKILDLDDATGKRQDIVSLMAQYKALGVGRVAFEHTEDGKSVLVNSSGPAVKRTRASSNGGSRGTASWEVDGQVFTSKELIEAHLDMLSAKTREHFDSGNFRAFSITREAERIHGLLTSGN